MSLLPTTLSESDTEAKEADEATTVGLQDESDVFSVLSSSVARDILIELYENKAAASELATRVGTSVQNIQYHIDKMVDSGVVEVAGTRYSSRGREMTVYAPAGNPLTMVIGDADCLKSCREVMTNIDAK